MLKKAATVQRQGTTAGNRVAPGDAYTDNFQPGKKAEVPAYCLQWQDEGPNRPSAGRQLISARLTEALAAKPQFTLKEWDAIGMVVPPRIDDFIKVGYSYFRPAAPLDKDAKDEKKQGMGKAEKGRKQIAKSSPPSKSKSIVRQPPVCSPQCFTCCSPVRAYDLQDADHFISAGAGQACPAKCACVNECISLIDVCRIP